MDFLIVLCAKYLIFILGLAVVAYGILSPRVSKVEFFSVAGLSLVLAYALARIAGMFVSHEQPFAAQSFESLIPHSIDNSFPSDHAAVAGALAGVASLYNKYLGILLWVLAVAVAAGRMLAGLHYPADVIAGLILGGLCAALAYVVVRRILAAQQ